MKKIRVRDITPRGMEIEDTIDANVLGLEKDDVVNFVTPFKVKAEIEKVDGTVLAKTKVHGKYASTCGRCLEPIEAPWEDKYLLDFEVDRTTEYIDIEDDIRQEILLHLPTRILCKEDCKGLCLDCGVNLNKEKCKCK